MARPISIDARATLAAAVPGVDLTRVHIIELPSGSRRAQALASRRIGAIALGQRVIAAGPMDELEPDAQALLIHELVHVRQASELGLMRFLAAYLGAYLAGRRRGLNHRDAYLANPFEVEAYDLARLTRRDWE